jgi:hypothetical protein
MVINYEPGCGVPHFGREPYDQRYEKFKVSIGKSHSQTATVSQHFINLFFAETIPFDTSGPSKTSSAVEKMDCR